MNFLHLFSLVLVICGSFSLEDFNDPVLVMSREGKNATQAPRFTVDLDSSPRERWANVAKHADGKFFENGVRSILAKVLPSQQLIDMAERIAANLNRYISQPYSDEMLGLSEASNINLGDIVLTNLIYDLTAYANSTFSACTSIVALDKDGQILHGRNLDYVDPTFLRNLTIQVDFMKNGKPVYSASTYIGYVGIITGVRYGAFSLTGNERNYGSLWLNILSYLEGSQLTFFTLRRVLDESSDYPSALNQLTNTPTAAPVYFILGGKKQGEGALVVRNGKDVAVVKHIGDYFSHPWFLVETNYDPWKQPPKSDDRRDVAIAALKKIGQKNMDAANLYKVLSTVPILNNSTTYTTIMSASNSSLFETMVRYDAPAGY